MADEIKCFGVLVWKEGDPVHEAENRSGRDESELLEDERSDFGV